MNAPAVSVVVPTRQRAAKLGRLVDALERQIGVAAFEVIVVDDASTDGTPDVLGRLAVTSTVPLRSLILPSNVGPATARNAGWRLARAPVVAFTDDDCIPSEHWLASLLAGIEGADMVQGCTLPTPDDAVEMRPLSRTMEVRYENGLYETCNMAYRRRLLEQLGGFDERFRYPYGEDADLGWRARAGGARVNFSPDALVYHEVVNPPFRSHLRELRRLDGAVLLLKLHPQARAYLTRGLFFRPSHPAAAAAVVGVSGCMTSRWGWRGRICALALVVPWLWQRLRSEPLPGGGRARVAALPQVLVSDVAQIAVLAVASARHRTLVL